MVSKKENRSISAVGRHTTLRRSVLRAAFITMLVSSATPASAQFAQLN
jgi:hypothetical protein